MNLVYINKLLDLIIGLLVDKIKQCKREGEGDVGWGEIEREANKKPVLETDANLTKTCPVRVSTLFCII